MLLPIEATDRDIAEFRRTLGLDQPLQIQYLKFLLSAIEGDFEVSLRQRTSALGFVIERLPATLELALTAFVLGIVLAFLLGLAMRRPFLDGPSLFDQAPRFESPE